MMLVKMMYSSINGFFNKNPIGKVLNRLSGDLSIIDRSIAYNQSSVLNVFSNLIVNFTMIIFATQWYLGLVYLIIFILLWRIR